MSSLTKTLVFKLDPARPNPRVINYSARVIKRGGLVAFPTETVYGIAANLLDKSAMRALREVKRRPRSKPFTVHVSDVGTLKELGCPLTARTKAVINKFWPGPLTVVLKSKKGANIGFRMPANKIALALIEAAGVPVVAPSANISGKRAPKSGREVLKELDGRIDILLDAGPTTVGVESTVVDLTVDPPKILREGAVKLSAISRQLSAAESRKPKAES